MPGDAWWDVVREIGRIVQKMPVLAQVVVLICILALISLLTYEKYLKAEKNIAPSPASASITGNSVGGNSATGNSVSGTNTNNVFIVPGSSAPIATAPDTHAYLQAGIRVDSAPNAENQNPQNRDAEYKSEEDNAAFRWHGTHEKLDSPPEMSIGTDLDDNNYLHYKYYQNSDKCVLVIRREAGVDHPQWIRDPLYHNHDPGAKQSLRRSVMGDGPEQQQAFFDLIPTASAQAMPSGPQFCVNPHPNHNDFKTWWGPPIDACNSGLFRQFADGCTHYQVYNRCANSWDGRIFWTYCHSYPHY